MIAVVGDSLTVGAEPYLPAAWHVDGRVSRTSAQGLYRVRHKLPSGAVLVWALGTNDTYSTFRLPARTRVAVTIYGTPGARAINRRIHRRLPSRCVVPWASWARRHRRHMSGVHADAYGYRVRARMTVRTVRQCL